MNVYLQGVYCMLCAVPLHCMWASVVLVPCLFSMYCDTVSCHRIDGTINFYSGSYNCATACPYLSDKRKGQISGTGGVAGRSLASAMMCSKVMSVCVHTSTTHTSCGTPPWLRDTVAVAPLGVRRRTWTTMGSRLMASTTASSWPALEKSRPFTWGSRGKRHAVFYLILLAEKLTQNKQVVVIYPQEKTLFCPKVKKQYQPGGAAVLELAEVDEASTSQMLHVI